MSMARPGAGSELVAVHGWPRVPISVTGYDRGAGHQRQVGRAVVEPVEARRCRGCPRGRCRPLPRRAAPAAQRLDGARVGLCSGRAGSARRGAGSRPAGRRTSRAWSARARVAARRPPAAGRRCMPTWLDAKITRPVAGTRSAPWTAHVVPPPDQPGADGSHPAQQPGVRVSVAARGAGRLAVTGGSRHGAAGELDDLGDHLVQGDGVVSMWTAPVGHRQRGGRAAGVDPVARQQRLLGARRRRCRPPRPHGAAARASGSAVR